MSATANVADPSSLPYRACVGVMLINRHGLVWVGRRRERVADDDDANWQMPQGGIDRGETPAAAAIRELREETGTGQAKILAEAKGWLHYDLPPQLIGTALKGKYRGQKQKWFAMEFLGSDADFNIHVPHGGLEPEFDDWRWENAARLPSLIVSFKRRVYEAVVQEFRSFLQT